MAQRKQYLHIRRNRQAVKGESLGAPPFDFLEGDVDEKALSTYDGADAFDTQDLASQDANKAEGTELENTGARGALSSNKEKKPMNRKPTDLELAKAEVAARIAALLLPSANSTAIENQAAIFARRLSSSELTETLERCWYDRQGSKIAAQKVASKQQKDSEELRALQGASKMAMDLDTGLEEGEPVEEEKEIIYDDEEQLPPAPEGEEAGWADAGCSTSGYATAGEPGDTGVGEGSRDDRLPQDQGGSEVIGGEEGIEDSMAADAQQRLTAGRKLQAKPIARTAGKKPIPHNPKRRQVTAADRRIAEEYKLSQIYLHQLGVPSDADMAKVKEIFQD